MKRTYGNRTVEISNPDKALFPDGTTKRELVDYYERIADVMLPHVRDRPLVLQRCPDGIDGDCFYQKEVADHFPDWIDRVTVSKRSGGQQTLVVANDRATLVWLANQAAITLHPWNSRTGSLECPDRLVIDLDPPDDDFDAVRRAARWCHELFEELRIEAWVKTSGSRGLHVVIALDGRADYESTRTFARDATDTLVRRHPDALTGEIRKDKREGRLYLDVARNAYAQTAVAPYAVRAVPGAPIAAPLDWNELGRGELDARSWTLANIFRRLGQRDDPWQGIDRAKASVAEASRRLQTLDG